MSVVVRRDNERGTPVKSNDDGGWRSDDVVLWLGMGQNGDVIEWWGEWLRLRWHFYSSEGWKSDCLRRVADSDGVDLMFWFRLEMGGNEMKYYRKMKWMQRAHLASMGRKRDTAWWCVTSVGGEAVQGRGKGGDNASWADANLTGPKNKERSIQLLQMDGKCLK
jgi:hypothetical protein